MVIQIAEETVGGDEISRLAVLSDDFCLHESKADAAVRNKTGIIQQKMWVVAAVENGTRGSDLLPVGEGAAPDNCTPCQVQILQRTVLLLKKDTECFIICFGMKFIRLAVQLIVNLPTDYRRVRSEMFCQLLNNAGRELLIDPGIIVIVSASTMTQQRLIRQSVKCFRVFCCQPGWRGSCGSAQNDLHAFFLTKCKEAVEEAEVKPALLRLKNSPAEFGYPDGGNTGIFHALQIFPPERFFPLLGIVADAQLIVLPLNHSKDLLFLLTGIKSVRLNRF